MGTISPQQSWGDGGLLSEPRDHKGNRLSCVEPDYTQYISAPSLRRMSRIIKMGVTASARALKEAGWEPPDGLITAPRYGCLEEPGIFLGKMVENKDLAVNPPPLSHCKHDPDGSQP